MPGRTGARVVIVCPFCGGAPSRTERHELLECGCGWIRVFLRETIPDGLFRVMVSSPEGRDYIYVVLERTGTVSKVDRSLGGARRETVREAISEGEFFEALRAMEVSEVMGS